MDPPVVDGGGLTPGELGGGADDVVARGEGTEAVGAGVVGRGVGFVGVEPVVVIEICVDEPAGESAVAGVGGAVGIGVGEAAAGDGAGGDRGGRGGWRGGLCGRYCGES